MIACNGNRRAVEKQEFIGLDHNTVKRIFFRLADIVGQSVSGQIHRRVAAVVKLDPVTVGSVRTFVRGAVAGHEFADANCAVGKRFCSADGRIDHFGLFIRGDTHFRIRIPGGRSFV